MLTIINYRGQAVTPDGGALPGAVVSFAPDPAEVRVAAGVGVVPAPVAVTADEGGQFLVSLLPGQYVARIRWEGRTYPTMRITASVAPDSLDFLQLAEAP